MNYYFPYSSPSKSLVTVNSFLGFFFSFPRYTYISRSNRVSLPYRLRVWNSVLIRTIQVLVISQVVQIFTTWSPVSPTPFYPTCMSRTFRNIRKISVAGNQIPTFCGLPKLLWRLHTNVRKNVYYFHICKYVYIWKKSYSRHTVIFRHKHHTHTFCLTNYVTNFSFYGLFDTLTLRRLLILSFSDPPLSQMRNICVKYSKLSMRILDDKTPNNFPQISRLPFVQSIVFIRGFTRDFPLILYSQGQT